MAKPQLIFINDASDEGTQGSLAKVAAEMPLLWSGPWAWDDGGWEWGILGLGRMLGLGLGLGLSLPVRANLVSTSSQ